MIKSPFCFVSPLCIPPKREENFRTHFIGGVQRSALLSIGDVRNSWWEREQKETPQSLCKRWRRQHIGHILPFKRVGCRRRKADAHFSSHSLLQQYSSWWGSRFSGPYLSLSFDLNCIISIILCEIGLELALLPGNWKPKSCLIINLFAES